MVVALGTSNMMWRILFRIPTHFFSNLNQLIMKKFLLSIVMLAMVLVMPAIALGANDGLPDIGNPFVSFLALSAAIPLVAAVVIGVVKPPTGFWTQIVSIVVGIGLTMFGWWFSLGFLAGLLWWHALIVGLSASLAANGIWDTGLYEAILKAIGILKREKLE